MTSTRRSSARKAQRSILESLSPPLPNSAEIAKKESAPKPERDTHTENATSDAVAVKRKKETTDKRKLKIEACHHLIEMAKHEMEDPYRGILDTSPDSNNVWIQCKDAMQSLQSGNAPGVEDNFGISCPCVQTWIQDEVEKKQMAARKSKRRKSSMIRPKAKSKSKKKGNNKSCAEMISVEEDLVESDITGDADNQIPSVVSDEEKSSEVIILDQDDSNVQASYSSDACAAQRKSNQSEKGFIRRNPAKKFTCECDYNPFCMVSLGGVMDDYLNHLLNRCLESTKSGSTFNSDLDETDTAEITNIEQQSKIQIEYDDDSSQGNRKELAGKGPVVVLDSKMDITKIMQIEGRPIETPQQTRIKYKLANDEKSQTVATASDSDNEESVSIDGAVDNSAGQDSTLRKPVFVDVEKIKTHLTSNIITGDGAAEEGIVEELISAIQNWHKSLIYEGNRCDSKGQFTICRPVGIRNLGATCYLNSQLQCLVSNLKFVHGVFNWTKGKGHQQSSQMSIVISRMQSLLARMVYGAQNVVCTDEFASALCLENNEMQDPNEFARLLFDRMHESFQFIPTMKSLLPDIFRGSFQYSTKCMRCKTVSCREEDFMDLNLPIQKPDILSSKKITLEMLLEEYLKPEMMDGDNKYHCDYCEDSCDAERSVAFSSTPQVLNIQLARYVFDLKKFQKRKLMDNILLPRSLHVDKQCGDRVKYILCGVQNHKGTSAYSGHYIAEVMDWTTGAWFEYNDEKVTFLARGPNSSYDPDQSSTTRLKGGNPDAYNLFYIQEQFLRSSVMDQIKLRSTPPSKGIIFETSKERENSFEIFRDLHLQAQKTLDRLNLRRSAILRLMLKPRSNEVPSVWVEGSTLRRFFSCTDSMEDLLNKDEPILRHKRLLCKHRKGLHPRVARCGKMLTKDQFQAYLDLLKLEREENIQDHDTGMFTMELKTNVCDLMITNTTCLHCDECASEYKSELADKYKSYCCLLSLENTLAPENDPDLNEDERLFAVSRSFVTNLRKFAASKILKYSIATKSCLASNCVDAPVVGVDHYDIGEFLAKFSNENTSTEKDGMDPCVNSKIVCEHGYCKKITNKQSIRYLTADTWGDINFLFPKAISIPLKYVDGIAQNCQLCREQKNAMSTVYDDICQWADDTALLLSNGEKYPVLTGYYRLVHAGDLTAQKKALDCVKNCRKRGVSSVEKLKETLAEAFFVETSLIGAENVKMQRLTCIQHEMPLLSIKTIQDIHFRYSKNSSSTVITDDTEETSIVVMNEDNYAGYLKSILKLQNILLDEATQSCDFDTFQSELQLRHPQLKITTLQNEDDSAIQTKFIISELQKGSKFKAHFPSEPCSEPACGNMYHDHIKAIQTNENNSRPEASKDEEKKDTEVEICANDNFFFEIHEFDGSSDSNEIRTKLEKKWNERLDGIEEMQQNRRRSLRKKNNSGSHTFKICGKKEIILAQFRLLVYEKSNNKKISSHQLHIFSFDEISRQGIMIELLGEWNERKMQTVLSELPIDVMNGTIHVVLIAKDSSLGKKRPPEEDIDDEETVFDMLVQMATNCQSPTSNTKSSRKRRRQERGFAGTFLQSSFHAPPPAAAQEDNGKGKGKNNDDRGSTSDNNDATAPEICVDLTDQDENLETGKDTKSLLEPSIPSPPRRINQISQHSKEKRSNPRLDFIYRKDNDNDNDNVSFPLEPLSSSSTHSIPDVPSYYSTFESYTKSDVESILRNVAEALKSKDDSDLETMKVQMRFDNAARNVYRNFVDCPISASDDSMHSKELPMSRNEMDIVLFYLSLEKSSESDHKPCHSLLMPYRSGNSVRYLFKLVKGQRILEDPKYEEYLSHVMNYVGMIQDLEIKLMN